MQNIETEEFAAWWAKYPRKVGKKDATKAWSRLADTQRAQAMATIEAHVRYWQQTRRTAETIPHPATWLNGWRFDDELPEVTSARFSARQYAATTRDKAIAQGLDGRTVAAAGRDLRRPARPH